MTASFSRSTEGVAVPAGRRVAGRLRVPPSKSLTHRAFNLALLAGRPARLVRPLDAEDTRLFRAALERLGWRVEPHGDALELWPGARPAAAELACGNAGTLFRFLAASLAALPGRWRLDGTPRLRQRPVGPLLAALRGLGARIECEGAEGFAPLRIEGRRLPGGRVVLDAGLSSQFLSALLMAGLTAAAPVEVEVAALTSGPYVDLTLEAAARFGGRLERVGTGFRVVPGPLAAPAEGFVVEGDFSAACYPAAAAALTGGEVTLEGLRAESRQGDRGFFDRLAAMGATVSWPAGGEVARVRGDGRLRALDTDLSGLPDQVPTLAALAPFARGTTRIRGVPHLRIKESDRLAAMAAGLRRLGAVAEERPDGLEVPGVWAAAVPPPPPRPLRVDPHDDHRIAMSLALVGLVRPGVVVGAPEVVAKSYPAFWSDLESLLAGSREAEGPGRGDL